MLNNDYRRKKRSWDDSAPIQNTGLALLVVRSAEAFTDYLIDISGDTIGIGNALQLAAH